MHKNKGSPLEMNDFEVTLLCDLTFPLISIYQLFWFSDKVTDFLRKNNFTSSVGVIIAPADGFTYERVKMERSETTCLLGFGSNTKGNCFQPLRILCFSEEEKLTIHKQIIQSIHELIEKVQERETGSFHVEWTI